MIELGILFYFITIACVIGINSFGVGIGEGLTGAAALDATNLQPAARNEISKIALFGTVLTETSAIMGLTIAIFMLVRTDPYSLTLFKGIATLGIALAISLSGLVVGIVSCWPAREACFAVARQPFFEQNIMRFMLITQSIIQTPLIFALIVAFMISAQLDDVRTLSGAIRLFSSGLCFGIGSIGPAIGLADFARVACRGLGINRHAYGTIFSFTFISEAIVETPIIFALVVSLMLLFSQAPRDNIIVCAAMLGAALSIGIGTIGAGISSGRTASAAVDQIAKKPEIYPTISKVSMLGQGIIDTSAVYALLVSVLIILFGQYM